MENIKLLKSENELLQKASTLIKQALEERENPSKLRLILVELQALRFTLGQSLAIYRCLARDETRKAYVKCKAENMSSSAAYKESEMAEKVVQYKNARDFLEVSFDTISSFVNINQTSLKIATEESKNNL